MGTGAAEVDALVRLFKCISDTVSVVTSQVSSDVTCYVSSCCACTEFFTLFNTIVCIGCAGTTVDSNCLCSC